MTWYFCARILSWEAQYTHSVEAVNAVRDTVTVLCAVAEAVQRTELEVGPFDAQGVGVTVIPRLHKWDKHSPVPAGGIQARAQAALSPSPQLHPEICSCITCRMGNLPFSH